MPRRDIGAGRRAHRAAHASLDQALRGREHDLAALSARLTSLEELEAARAGFSDAARVVLAGANGRCSSTAPSRTGSTWTGATSARSRRWLGDLLQHVVVPSHAHATSGLQLLREQEAGRCGFLVLADPVPERARLAEVPGLRRDRPRSFGAPVPTRGPSTACCRAATSPTRSRRPARRPAPRAPPSRPSRATSFRGSHIVVGGGRHEGRGILAAKGEIRELRTRITAEREQVAGLAAELAAAASTVAGIGDAIQTTGAELHEHEKAIVGFEAAVARTREDAARLERKGETLTAERRRADEEIGRLDERHAEARSRSSR